jgi:hypothetical protein
MPSIETINGLISEQPASISFKNASAHATDRFFDSIGLVIGFLFKVPIDAASDIRLTADPDIAGPIRCGIKKPAPPWLNGLIGVGSGDLLATRP